MARTVKSSPPTKIWLSTQAKKFLNDYKGMIAETKNSVAVIRMIKLGLKAGSDGRYGQLLKDNRITIDKLTQLGVRIDKNLDLEVRSHGGKLNLNLSQAYFDVICAGLAVIHFSEHLPKPEMTPDFGSILVIDPDPMLISNEPPKVRQVA